MKSKIKLDKVSLTKLILVLTGGSKAKSPHFHIPFIVLLPLLKGVK